MKPAPMVKCLVWDLDDTLWQGTVLEGDAPEPFPGAVATLRALDERGILHAVASRGDHATATARLTALGLTELFTVLEIGWGNKSDAVRHVAAALNIGIDTVAFIDNDAVERAEVATAHPQVRCYPAEQAAALPGLAEFQPGTGTAESRQRRSLYQGELRRKRAQEEHTGPPREFQESLGLVLTVRRATEPDLERAEELTVRTHQLNTTGRTYDAAELRALCHSPDHRLLVASLEDRFGSYGTIGLALSELRADSSVLRLFLLSCRVMSRGIGPALLGHLVRESLSEGRRPLAEFVPTDVNRVMLVNLRFSGFEQVERTGDRILLGYATDRTPPAQDGAVRIVTDSSPSQEITA